MDALDRLAATLGEAIKITADGVARGTADWCAATAMLTANDDVNADYKRACWDIYEKIKSRYEATNDKA